MTKYNAKEILDAASITQVIGRHIHLEQKGQEAIGLCPFHTDDKPSLKVNEKKQIYKCFACGASGDAIDFLTRSGRTFQEACAEIINQNSLSPLTPEQRASQAKARVEWMQIKPVPATAPDPPKHYRMGAPSMKWEYRDRTGALLGLVCRFDTPDGKEVMPLVFATDGIRTEWRWLGFDKPRPLWNLPEINDRPEVPVVIFEGEKTAAAGKSLLPDYVATTWIGGARAIKATDWTPLIGRRVIFWPDNDTEFKYPETHARAGQIMEFKEQPGNAAMLDIFEVLKKQCPGARWVKNPPDARNKWDIADATWTPEEATTYLKENQINPATWKAASDKPKEKKAKTAAAEKPTPTEPTPSPEPARPVPAKPAPQEEIDTQEHFRFLGYDKTDAGVPAFNFFSNASRITVKLTAGQMTTNNLMTLAPLKFWSEFFPGTRGAEVAMNPAINWLIQRSSLVGIYDQNMKRGRGAWMDGDQVVIHAGNQLIIDRKNTDFKEFETRYVYEKRTALDIRVVKEAPIETAKQVLELFELCNWEREINAKLLAGWCVVAPVCGALKWRPHIWITGPAGCGKSYVFKDLLRPLLGNTCLAVQSQTTEAGLRQTLDSDALPVVFDEAEGEDKRNQDRMAAILALMRASSAEDGGIMAKGTSSGSARANRVRSCFAFASISLQVAHQSDRSRVTILGMKAPKAHDPIRQERWTKLKALRAKMMSAKFTEQLISRTITLLPKINESAQIFAENIYELLGDQRASDQLAYLLAGAWSLQSDQVVTPEQAVEFTSLEDWEEESGLNETKDELACINYLMEQEIKIESSVGIQNRNVGELVGIAANMKHDEVILPDRAVERLMRIGIRVDNHNTDLVVSNSANWVMEALQSTPWAKNHNRTLLRVPGARAKTSVRFGSGVSSRAVQMPLKSLLQFTDSGTEPIPVTEENSTFTPVQTIVQFDDHYRNRDENGNDIPF